jgi:nitric oxide reductase activation protein
MTKELILSDEFPMIVKNGTKSIANVYQCENQKNVDDGIVLGIKLGRRLQIRNEINIDKFTRRNVGKIDKRLMHELGFDTNTNIFYNTLTTKYKKVNFHISVDASASMRGRKWNRTIKLCVALTKAISMINNVDVTVSFRTSSGNNPYIAIAYDSRVDKFTKIKNLFAYLSPVNTTPEGLCFEALIRYLPKASTDTNSYFINISDGEPMFIYNSIGVGSGVGSFKYHGAVGCDHTRKQVNKIRESGYNVISYFVSEYTGIDQGRDNFKMMYGKDANFINIENLNQIVSTINTKMMDAIDG